VEVVIKASGGEEEGGGGGGDAGSLVQGRPAGDDESCLLVLDSVTATPQWIRQPNVPAVGWGVVPNKRSLTPSLPIGDMRGCLRHTHAFPRVPAA
jgi:hypothetical protein